MTPINTFLCIYSGVECNLQTIFTSHITLMVCKEKEEDGTVKCLIFNDLMIWIILCLSPNISMFVLFSSGLVLKIS